MAALNTAVRLELPLSGCVIPLIAIVTQCLRVGNNFIFLVLHAMVSRIKTQNFGVPSLGRRLNGKKRRTAEDHMADEQESKNSAPQNPFDISTNHPQELRPHPKHFSSCSTSQHHWTWNWVSSIWIFGDDSHSQRWNWFSSSTGLSIVCTHLTTIIPNSCGLWGVCS